MLGIAESVEDQGDNHLTGRRKGNKDKDYDGVRELCLHTQTMNADLPGRIDFSCRHFNAKNCVQSRSEYTNLLREVLDELVSSEHVPRAQRPPCRHGVSRENLGENGVHGLDKPLRTPESTQERVAGQQCMQKRGCDTVVGNFGVHEKHMLNIGNLLGQDTVRAPNIERQEAMLLQTIVVGWCCTPSPTKVSTDKFVGALRTNHAATGFFASRPTTVVLRPTCALPTLTRLQ